MSRIRVVKRDGALVPFNTKKVAKSIYKAAESAGGSDFEEAEEIADYVTEELLRILEENNMSSCSAQVIQDVIISTLVHTQHTKTVTKYIEVASSRERARSLDTKFMNTVRDITFNTGSELDNKRENANINSDTAMGTMLKYGSETAKELNLTDLIRPEISQLHRDGTIHIHDLDFYFLTATCCQIDLKKLFKGGFNTGHGFLREPGSIGTAGALTAIAIQSNQNDQHKRHTVLNTSCMRTVPAYREVCC